MAEDAARDDGRYLSHKRCLEGPGAPEEAALGVALFGLGRIGTIHLQTVARSARARLLYCVEGSPSRADFARRALRDHAAGPAPRILAPEEEDAAFDDPRVAAVLVCTPTPTHERLVLKALRSGKAVFCEKPLALDDAGIGRCLRAAEEKGAPLLCAFNRRFDPGLRSVKRRAAAGELGQLRMVKTCSRDSPRPSVDYLRTSGGLFHDCGVHDIDLACWLLGERPVRVSAQAHGFGEDVRALRDFDSAAILMTFPSGAMALVDLARHAVYGYDQRVEVFGSAGMLTCGDVRPDGVRHHGARGATATPIFFSFASRYQEAYVAEVEHFLRVAQGLEECEVEGDAVLAASRIAAACERSARTGDAVALSW